MTETAVRTHSWCRKCGVDVGDLTPTPHETLCIPCFGPPPPKDGPKFRQPPGTLLQQNGGLRKALSDILLAADPGEMKEIARKALDGRPPLAEETP